MAVIVCPFCQHENTSGTRFCAECGCSIHLKVCAKCGKISEVDAEVCASCGEAFPKIALVPKMTGKTGESVPTPAKRESGATGAGAAPSRTAAWPLVAIAIVAGGLPLLWANRAQLPTPKTWQIGSPEATKPPEPVLAPQLVPAAPSPPPPPASSPVRSEHDSVKPAGSAAPDDRVPSQKPRQTAGQASKEPTKAPRPPKKKAFAEPATPCTEAAVALGLCKSVKQGK